MTLTYSEEIREIMQTYPDFLKQASIQRQEITLWEINSILENNSNIQKIVDFIMNELKDIENLQNDWKNPETLKFCSNNFNLTLRETLKNEELLQYISIRKTSSKGHLLRKKILKICSDFLDKDLLKIIAFKEDEIPKNKKNTPVNTINEENDDNLGEEIVGEKDIYLSDGDDDDDIDVDDKI